MSKFQLILLFVFGAFILIGVLIFSLYRGSNSGSADITIWGDISSRNFSTFLNSSGLSQDRDLSIKYVEKNPDTLKEEFTESLALGRGPDLILVDQSTFWSEREKLILIPYQSISERSFRDTFAEEGELFLTNEGIYALPLYLDPMMLYYNRDILSSAGLSRPLSYWDEIYASIPSLVERDGAGNIVQAAIALGEARNISHAKEVFSLLSLQAGTPITDVTSNGLEVYLRDNFNLPVSPGLSALDFYTQFSNPTKAFYTWNRALIDAQTHFTSGDTAYYLGFASELSILRSKNPTLNFGVARVPQSRVSGRNITFANIKAVAVSRGTSNPTAALSTALSLASKDANLVLSQVLSLPPARRDLLADAPSDAVFNTFYESAIQAKGWVDPSSSETDAVFRNMIESVTSGRARNTEALNLADRELDLLTN